jgi:membrane-associated phospholipid phosphatase
MLAAVAAADLSKRLTKSLVRRTRPHVLLDEGRYETDAGGSEEKPEQSFPSGHTACSVAAARALSRTYPAAGASAGLAAIAIGVSRIVKGAHWPLDVAGGAVIGLAAEALSAALLRFARRKVTANFRA